MSVRSSSGARELFTRFDTGHRCNRSSAADWISEAVSAPSSLPRKIAFPRNGDLSCKFIKPTASSGDAGDRCRACFRMDRASMLRRHLLGQKNLTALRRLCPLPGNMKGATGSGLLAIAVVVAAVAKSSTIRPWSTTRAMVYGSAIGVAAAAFKLFAPWSEPHSGSAIAREFIGARSPLRCYAVSPRHCAISSRGD
jgi:hypothetical protein